MKCLLSVASVENNNPTIRAIKPSAIFVKKSVTDFFDTAEITLPLNPYLRRDNSDGTLIERRNIVLNTGDKVSISMGYDDEMNNIFEGFIARIDKSVPMKLYCEGYAFLLRDVIFNRSYNSVSLVQLLSDLTRGTDIRISPHTAQLTIPQVAFRNTPAVKVLEWIEKELLCRVWFDGRMLYAGASLYAIPKSTTRFKLGYNTVKDDSLRQDTQAHKVAISVVEKEKTGTTKRVKDVARKYSATREIRIRPGTPELFKRAVAAELQELENNRGFQGSITTFLLPFVDKAFTVDIADDLYPERAGRYFAESVQHSFSPSGGRQTIKLIHYAK